MPINQKIYLFFKRSIGILGSFVGIIVCCIFLWWWVLPINAIVTKGHPFFGSFRVGRNNKMFRCIKFRSMRNDADPMMTSRDSKTMNSTTKFGKFLRVSSIDETPQLFNIFIGQMAFIGPRPLINIGDDAITIKIRNKNGTICLRPGLTGYAQIHKRGELNPVTKAEYDYLYYQNFSFWLDIKIFIYTLLKLFGAAKGR